MTMERFMRKRGKRMPSNPELDRAIKKRKIIPSGVGDVGGEEGDDELHVGEMPVNKIKTRKEIEEENARKLEELKRKFGIE